MVYEHMDALSPKQMGKLGEYAYLRAKLILDLHDDQSRTGLEDIKTLKEGHSG